MTDTLTPAVQINIILPGPKSQNWPANKRAEARLEFLGKIGKGMTLTGFTVWQNKKNDGLTVSVPARLKTPKKGNAKGDAEYFDFFYGPRACKDDFDTLILKAYHEQVQAAAAPAA